MGGRDKAIEAHSLAKNALKGLHARLGRAMQTMQGEAEIKHTGRE